MRFAQVTACGLLGLCLGGAGVAVVTIALLPLVLVAFRALLSVPRGSTT
jgi:hypothetical protein